MEVIFPKAASLYIISISVDFVVDNIRDVESRAGNVVVCHCNLPCLHLYSTAGSALALWIDALAVQSAKALALSTRRCGRDGTNLSSKRKCKVRERKIGKDGLDHDERDRRRAPAFEGMCVELPPVILAPPLPLHCPTLGPLTSVSTLFHRPKKKKAH